LRAARGRRVDAQVDVDEFVNAASDGIADISSGKINDRLYGVCLTPRYCPHHLFSSVEAYSLEHFQRDTVGVVVRTTPVEPDLHIQHGPSHHTGALLQCQHTNPALSETRLHIRFELVLGNPSACYRRL